MQTMKISSLFIILTILFFSTPLSLFAQGIPTSINGIELSLSSNNPVPGQNVTITARSYTIDIDSATIIWKIDGKEMKRGVGDTKYVVSAPPLSKVITINVIAIASDGKIVSNNISLGSGSVDIITESSGYLPPFFNGKIPLVFQNNLKIIAVPHLADESGVEYNPKDIVYRWEKNDLFMNDNSGYGKQNITIPGSLIPRPFDMTVTATSKDGKHQAKTITTISYNDPKILFYSNDPLYGPLFNISIPNKLYLNNNREANILAVPYGFDKPRNDIGNLNFIWSINGNEETSLSKNESITVRSPETSFGTSDIQLTITNNENILQKTQNLFQIVFKALSSNNNEISL